MKVLIYNELNPKAIPGFAKLQSYLEDDDFKSAEVKKVGDNLYRARLNQRDRLLFSIYRHQEQSYALILEFIKNHAYQDCVFCVRSVVSMKIKFQSYISLMKPVTKHWFILTRFISHLTCWIKSSPLMTANS